MTKRKAAMHIRNAAHTRNAYPKNGAYAKCIIIKAVHANCTSASARLRLRHRCLHRAPVLREQTVHAELRRHSDMHKSHGETAYGMHIDMRGVFG